MVSTPKFAQYAKALGEGTLTLEDVRKDALDPADFRKLRMNHPQMFGVSKAAKYDLGATGEDARRRYVFVTESAIGHFHDVPRADAWQLDSFEKRRNPILFGHNLDEDRPPIGRAFEVKTNQVVDGVRSMTGGVQFDTGSEFNAMVYSAIDRGFLNGFSVGFDILEGREPTPEEVKQFELNEYATIFTKTSLTEGSIVPVGRDPRAGVMAYAKRQEELDAWLVGQDGSADDKRRFRMTLFGAKSDRKVVTLGETLKEEPQETAREEPKEEPQATPEEQFTALYVSQGGDPQNAPTAYAEMQARASENKQRPATYGELTERDEELRSLRTQTRALEAENADQGKRIKSIEALLTGFGLNGGAAPEGDGVAGPDESTLESELLAYIGEN